MARKRASTALAITLLIYLAYLALQFFAPGDPEAAPTSERDGWYSLFFTNPRGAAASSLRGGPDAALASAIDSAERTVDLAAYDLDLWSIQDAVIRAHDRGLRVRLVTESDHMDEPEVKALQAAGVPMRGDNRSPLMHHKFVVIDGEEVWTGSMNLTVNGAYRNNNNLIRLSSPWLAESYGEEFDEMFVYERFGALSLPDLPALGAQVGGTPVEVLFSPDDGVGPRIVALISAAQDSLQIMAFNLTLDTIAEAIVERSSAGLLIQGLFDAGQANNQGSDVDLLAEAGIDIALDGNPRKMHHKVIVIDGEIVITGSYNFSRNAEEKNDENVLVIYSEELADQYLAEFERLRAEAGY